jgi:lipoate-protein ligase B
MTQKTEAIAGMTGEGNLLDLGFREYGDVWDLQRKLVDLRTRKVIPDTLILVQHSHVFTVGKGVLGDLPTQISGVPVFRIERGGQWTYHGPGQLVGYLILDLDIRQRNIHSFLRKIEETIILALEGFGINAERHQGQTGVWVQKKKIASIGAAIRKWVSFHGFALNVNTDLNYFHMITPCGCPSSTMTSMEALLGRKIDFIAVKNVVRRTFEQVFELRLTVSTPEFLEASVARAT